MDNSSRLRSGTFEDISILPPRCIRKVRSLTLWTRTPSIAPRAATMAWACSVSRAAQVTSMRMRLCLVEDTSCAVINPPARYTEMVIMMLDFVTVNCSYYDVMDYDC